MRDHGLHPAVERIVAAHGPHVLDLLADTLSGADLTALLLEVARRRADRLAPSDVMRQYASDRFVRPALVASTALAELELLAHRLPEPTFDMVRLAPVAPLGTHSVVAGVAQNRVLATTRGTEVAADPTNALALEAAVRRRSIMNAEGRSAVVRLAGCQRVTRTQQFEGPLSFAHFSLLGAVIAGRDIGNQSFERAALIDMLTAATAFCSSAGAESVSVRLTDFSGEHQDVLDDVCATLDGPELTLGVSPDREAGRGYYPSICWKLLVTLNGDQVEVGDGGFVPWTQSLLANAKERLLIGGISLDRLALVRPV